MKPLKLDRMASRLTTMHRTRTALLAALAVGILLAVTNVLRSEGHAALSGSESASLPRQEGDVMTQQTPVPPPPSGVAPAPPNTPVAVWSHAPTLGLVTGQQYIGRLIVEVDGSTVAFVGVGSESIARAIAALQAPTSFPDTPAAWPRQSVLGSGQEAAFRGRVVLEFWTTTTNVALTLSSGTREDLVQGALELLRQRRR
jgi:hypothetical protein